MTPRSHGFPSVSPDAYLDRYRSSGVGVSFAVLESVDSTNRLARSVAEFYLAERRRVPEIVLVAGRQTAGRGRLGRVWESPAGGGIYTSLLTSVATADELATLPLRVPTALCAALQPCLGPPCRIKWPNDLVVEGRKLGGVLIEAIAGPRAVVVGYGINYAQSAGELPTPEATSIRLVSDSPPALEVLTLRLAKAVLDELARARDLAEILDRYGRRSIHSPGEALACRVGSETVAGVFQGFDGRGRLRLRTAAGERLLSAGEIVQIAPADREADG